MAINLPPFTVEPLVRLFELSPEDKSLLLKGLQEAENSANPYTYSQRIARLSPSLQAESLVDIINVLSNIYNLALINRNPEIVSGDVTQALKELNIENLQSATEEQYTDFERFIKEALGARNFGTGAKAQRLTASFERLYGSSEIISDIRPIFSAGDVEILPEDAIVTHALRLTSYENGVAKERYFAMNFKDLLQLQKDVERAVKKHATLSQLMSKFGMRYVSDEGDED